jgi:hypothetical protein
MSEPLGIIAGIIAIILIFGGPPITIILVYYFSRRAKNRERMAMIEKGVDPTLYIKESPLSHKVLLWGMLLGGIGFGLFLGYIIAVIGNLPLAPLMPILATMFGGLGLIGHYFYRRKAEARQSR